MVKRAMLVYLTELLHTQVSGDSIHKLHQLPNIQDEINSTLDVIRAAEEKIRKNQE